MNVYAISVKIRQDELSK